ncbi:hypothetical protein Q1M62_28365 [Sinorhizobium meliloti]|nr:hypothetical protein Q1M62_28365 [Sinorhizobium meliloti]
MRAASRSPLGEIMGPQPLIDPDRLAAAQKIAREKALTALDAAGFVEAYTGCAQRLDIGAVAGAFLPAAALEIVVGNIAPVEIAREQVFKRAGPQVHDSRLSDNIGKLIEVEVVKTGDEEDMAVEHVLHCLAPFRT